MRWLAAGLVLLTIVAAWSGWRVWNGYLATPLPVSEPVTYEVTPGRSLGAVALDLEDRGWLRRPAWFVWHARHRGDQTRIRAGEYRIAPGITPVGLLDLLVSGDVVQHAFTIIEGATFAELRASLAAHPVVAKTLDGLADDEVMARLGMPGEHPEGRFLPETYYFTRGKTDLELLERANGLLEKTLTRLWRERDPGTQQLDSPYEALILASIIEKETALESERHRISGVFHRRLQKGMRLQSDPTVIYGLGPDWDGDIRKRDLQTDTPWNTYTRKGLPPTPIAMAGEAAISAAVHPADGTALFFVATGEPDGSHYFSDTIEEHNAAVSRYLARRKKKHE